MAVSSVRVTEFQGDPCGCGRGTDGLHVAGHASLRLDETHDLVVAFHSDPAFGLWITTLGGDGASLVTGNLPLHQLVTDAIAASLMV